MKRGVTKEQVESLKAKTLEDLTRLLQDKAFITRRIEGDKEMIRQCDKALKEYKH